MEVKGSVCLKRYSFRQAGVRGKRIGLMRNYEVRARNRSDELCPIIILVMFRLYPSAGAARLISLLEVTEGGGGMVRAPQYPSESGDLKVPQAFISI